MTKKKQLEFRRIHHSPLFWVGAVLFLAAIAIYVFSDDLSWRPRPDDRLGRALRSVMPLKANRSASEHRGHQTGIHNRRPGGLPIRGPVDDATRGICTWRPLDFCLGFRM